MQEEVVQEVRVLLMQLLVKEVVVLEGTQVHLHLQSGTANTGGGGGGVGNTSSITSGAGGSGVVILRMRTSDYSGTTTGSPTVTVFGDETILKYTGSGTYVHS